MRPYQPLAPAPAPAADPGEGSEVPQPLWKRALKYACACCCCLLISAVLFVGLLTVMTHSLVDQTGSDNRVNVTPAETIPAEARQVMARSVKPQTRAKVDKVAAGMEATLSLPDLPEGTMSRAELAKAVELVRGGLDEDGHVISAFQDVHAAASLTQSAETAAANGMLLTAEDIKELSGGAPGLMEGEHDMEAPGTGETERRLGWVASGRPWAGGVVNYCFAEDFPERSRKFFDLATRAWHLAVPCLTFKNVGWKSGKQASRGECQQSPAIFVGNDQSGCNSVVGMGGGFQKLNLDTPGCIWVSVIQHELGHALGMSHEQCRSDRDRYIHVQWQNIGGEKWQSQFSVRESAYTGAPYDYLSTMHYGQQSADKPWFTVPSGAGVDASTIGQLTALSKGDIAQAYEMYESEVPDCQAMRNRKDGETIKGCVDTPGADCSGSSEDGFCAAADPERKGKCCACGGGVEVRCYERRGCPNVTASLIDVLPIERPSWLSSDLKGVLVPLLCVMLGLLACACFLCCCLACLCPGVSLFAAA